MWCLVGLLSLGSAALSQVSTAGSGTEKAVAALEQQWLQSQKTNNPDMVSPLLADKCVKTKKECVSGGVDSRHFVDATFVLESSPEVNHVCNTPDVLQRS